MSKQTYFLLKLYIFQCVVLSHDPSRLFLKSSSFMDMGIFSVLISLSNTQIIIIMYGPPFLDGVEVKNR